MVSGQDLQDYSEDGVVALRGLFREWIEPLRRATDSVLENPGPFGKDAANPGATGRFFQERSLWTYHAAFREFVYHSPAARLSGELMRSDYALLYSDHLFVKESHTRIPTPWHQDYSYFTIAGWKQCSIWVALDEVDATSGGLEFVRGSHRWDAVFAASDFSNRGNRFANEGMQPLPDIDARRDEFDLLSFALEPGDCVVFHHRMLHGAAGNGSTRRRRALSTRWAGDDVVFRPTSNAGGDPSLTEGAPIESAMHPRLWQRTSHDLQQA